MVSGRHRREHTGARIVHGQADRYSFFRGGGLGGRPRTPNFTPPWGRSSWNKPRAGRKPQERRFEEVDSDEDDGQGVTLDRSYYRDSSFDRAIDSRNYTRNRGEHYETGDSYSSDEGGVVEDRSGATMQVVLRNKEDQLVQQAMERIRRAQMLGKRNVELSEQEIEALERNRRQDRTKHVSARGDSGPKQTDRRRSSGQLRSGAKEPKPGKRRSVGLSPTMEFSRNSDERAATPPGFLVPGRDGRLVYAPVGYYPPTIDPVSSGRGSRSGSRSGSSANLQQSSPPLPSNQYWAPQPRYPQESDYLPPLPASRASPIMRRLPDDPHWNPRPRSASSNQSYPLGPQYYQQIPSSPPPASATEHYSQGRRIVSGPADVPYPISRKPLPMSSAQAASSEPTLSRRDNPGGTFHDENLSGGETDDDDDDDDNDYGVQVHVSPDMYGHNVRRGPEPPSGIRPRRSQR
ncbi:MAG: hypothetical protein Q9222_000117 [Ikaeria aurantiellina]